MSQFIKCLIEQIDLITTTRGTGAFSIFSLLRTEFEKMTFEVRHQITVSDQRNDSSKIFEISNFFLERGFFKFALSGNSYFCKNPDEPDSVLAVMNASGNVIGFKIAGNHDTISKIHEELKENFPNEGIIVQLAGIPFPGKPYSTLDHYLETSAFKPIHPSFYPSLKIEPDAYFDAFFKSNRNILLLIGQPGTGKTTFLRNMIQKQKAEAMIVYDVEIMNSRQPLEHFIHSYNNLLVIEDADTILSKRTDGNNLMSYLLNMSDGIAANNKKIVFSTNLENTDEIDQALMRPGRCFDILHFDLLDAEQAQNVLEDAGLPFRDFSSKPKWTLAEVFNDSEDFLHTKERELSKKTKIGF